MSRIFRDSHTLTKVRGFLDRCGTVSRGVLLQANMNAALSSPLKAWNNPRGLVHAAYRTSIRTLADDWIVLSGDRMACTLLYSTVEEFTGQRRTAYPRRRQGVSALLIKYPLVLLVIRMPRKYAPFVAYRADCGGREGASSLFCCMRMFPAYAGPRGFCLENVLRFGDLRHLLIPKPRPLLYSPPPWIKGQICDFCHCVHTTKITCFATAVAPLEHHRSRHRLPN
jgi:hypothetical protein